MAHLFNLLLLLLGVCLAHLSRRLIHVGEHGPAYIRRCRPSLSSVDHNAQISSPKPLGQSKPNFMGSLLGRGNESLFAASGSHDQDGHHALIW